MEKFHINHKTPSSPKPSSSPRPQDTMNTARPTLPITTPAAQGAAPTPPRSVEVSSYMQSYAPPTGAVPTTNTHHYDGALPWDSELGILLTRIRSDTETSDTRREVVDQFVLEITTYDVPERNPISMDFLTRTVHSWGQTANNDGTNDITADELLFVCAQIWNTITTREPELLGNFAKEFFTQFMDMQTGPCPQGRTVRLWQLAYFYLQWHPDFYDVHVTPD